MVAAYGLTLKQEEISCKLGEAVHQDSNLIQQLQFFLRRVSVGFSSLPSSEQYATRMIQTFCKSLKTPQLFPQLGIVCQGKGNLLEQS